MVNYTKCIVDKGKNQNPNESVLFSYTFEFRVGFVLDGALLNLTVNHVYLFYIVHTSNTGVYSL